MRQDEPVGGGGRHEVRNGGDYRRRGRSGQVPVLAVGIVALAVACLAVMSAAGQHGRHPAVRPRSAVTGRRARTASAIPVSAIDRTTTTGAAGTETSQTETSQTETPVPATPEPPPPTPITLSGPGTPVFYRLPLTAPVVFVTIDDGWVRDPRVVSFLDQTHWPVSMFLIERAAREAPGYYRQLSAAGGVVEDHTIDHPHLTYLGAARQQHEICEPVHDYPQLLDHTPTLLRPPYGAWNLTTRQAAHACGLTAIVEWSAVMSDGHLSTTGPRLRDGDIILLHFTTHLYADLVTLRQLLAGEHFAVGRLESYLTAPAASGPASPAPSTSTSAPPAAYPTPTTAPARSSTTTTTTGPTGTTSSPTTTSAPKT